MQTVIAADNVSVRRGANLVLQDFSWTVSEGEHWVVLGPNGAGKTTLMLLVGSHCYPSSGTVRILGQQLGLTDVFELRPRIGLTSAGVAEHFRPEEKVIDIVRTAAHGMTGSWREQYESQDTARALSLLADWGMAGFASRGFSTLSEGERKRVLIARALMSDPELLLLDEPTAGMDLLSREELLELLNRHGSSSSAPVSVLVTHHVEEIPSNSTHVLLLNKGRVVAQGPIEQTLNEPNLAQTFGLPVELVQRKTSRGPRYAVIPR